MPRLLLVDDSPMMHRIVELTFARENVQVIAVRDGDQAIHAMSSTRPDIVLADHAAAGRNGYELAAFVKSQPDLAGVRVLLMGGAFEPVDELRAAQSGSDGVVVKPLEPRQLVDRVRALLEPQPSVPRFAESGAAVGAAVAETERLRPSDDGLDDYFDQLDAALGHLGISTASQLPAGLPEHAEASGMDAPEPAPGEPRAEESAFATAPPEHLDLPTVDALLGDVSWTGDRSSLERPAEPPADPGSSVAPDDLVEQVTRRVLERLAPEAIDRVVREIVLEVAERQVREEVERIKTAGDR